MLSGCRECNGYIKRAGVGKIFGILLVCTEAQIGNYVPGTFRLIKCCSEKHQSSAISLTIIFHREISPGGNTVEETLNQNSTYYYTSHCCDYSGELIFPRLLFFSD